MTAAAMTRNEMKTPIWLRAIAGLGIVWYGFGLLQFWLGYTMDTGAAVYAGLITTEHRAAIDGTPFVIWASFAIASFAGLIGAVFLFAQSVKSKTLFATSLISAALYYSWVYALSGTGADRPSEEMIIAGVVGAVTLGFFLLSRRVT